MRSTRYSIAITNRTSGRTRRYSVSARPLVVLAIICGVLPLLLLVGASRKAAWERAVLASQVESLEAENASMRATTGALTSQIGSLQAVVDDLSRLAPTEAEQAAMRRLPARVQREALGGLSRDAARLALLGPNPAGDAVGVVRHMLEAIESRLETARPQIESRAALARATPSIWPALGPLSSSFGARRDPFSLEPSLHTGLDLDVEHGAPVHVTADGIVTATRPHPEYGNLVVVTHGFGIETRYAHLSAFSVTEGTRVARGQVVGRAGSTGRSTGTHVHYEVWIGGQAVNPLRYLVAREAP